jgi:hypothetical protein
LHPIKLHFENAASISRIYEYIAPINTVPQELFPNYPAGGSYKNSSSYLFGKLPSETAVDFEIGVLNNDANLFSNSDDSNNQGISGK